MKVSNLMHIGLLLKHIYFFLSLLSEAFHIRPQGFFIPLSNGEQVIHWPLKALSSDEVVQEGVAQLLEAIDGDVGNFMNHSLAAPLRVAGKERHSISSGGC